MSEEELLSLIRNHNMSDEELTNLAFLILKEVCNKKESSLSNCFLCGGDEEYMGEPCSACE